MPKFRNKNGDLSAYAFACGYIQRATNQGVSFADSIERVDLWFEGACWHVRLVTDTLNEWQSFKSLTLARSIYKSIKKQYNLIQLP